jgi:short-subunit dehydrogenase
VPDAGARPDRLGVDGTKHAVEALSDALRFEVRGYGIDVIVIEPGLIRSGFGDAAAASVESRPEVATVYDAFNAAVAKATRESYERGPAARLAGSPDDVARAIGKALTARRPKARIKATASARLLLAQRRWSSDRAWDWFLRQRFPSPGAEKHD